MVLEGENKDEGIEDQSDESSFVEGMGLDKGLSEPTPEEGKGKGDKKENIDNIDDKGTSKETEEEREELDSRAEEAGLEAGASEEDIETAELEVRAEEAGLERDATVEEIEKAEKKEKGSEEEEEPEDEIKDLTKEEIEKLPKDAKGLYYAYKKEKGKRQKIEAEKNYLVLKNKYSPKASKEEEPEEEPEKEFETVEDILKDKADDDLLTVGEQRRIKVAESKQAEKDNKKVVKVQNKVGTEQQRQIERMDEFETAYKETHPDYDDMLNIFSQAVNDFPALQYEILAELKRANGDPAGKVYQIGQKFKATYSPKKTTVDGKPVKKDVKRIFKNAKKKTPSASVAGSSIGLDELSEMDPEELGEALSKMTMAQYMRVPKKLQSRALGLR